MQIKLSLVGAEAHEQTPVVALYSLDTAGRIASKLAVAKDGKLEINEKNLKGKVAFGPDVADPATLDTSSLLTVQASAQIANWRETGEIMIPSQWWRLWPGFWVCLTGKAQRCLFFDGIDGLVSLARADRSAIIRPPFPIFCQPLCNGIVEIWECTCCCWPIVIWEIPRVINNIGEFLEGNPIMFPPIPGPDPGPMSRELKASVNRARAEGKVSTAFLPSTELAQHYETLQSLSAQDAATYIETYPILWPFWCNCTTSKMTEVPLNPDGSFSYCFLEFPFFPFNCQTSYFYKVKQLIGGVWTYVYDGAAAHQYFTAAEFADLETWSGMTCNPTNPPPGTDFVAFQAIGLTNTYDLYSNWGGMDGAGNDLTQNGDYSLTALPTDAGLNTYGGAPGGNPWGSTLSFLLSFDPGMEGLGAHYYRMSYVQADATGIPLGGATPVVINNGVPWDYWQLVGTNWQILSQSLGPVTVAGVNGLYQIPYWADKDWLGNQFHQTLDTTTLLNGISPGPGRGNGQYLIIVEVFDSSGNRLIPKAAAKSGPTDKHTGFNFIRLLTSGGVGSTSNVQYAALTQVVWVDNRPCVAEIDEFLYVDPITGTHSSSAECQFLTAPGDDLFEVGFRAYHPVMGDPAPNPVPSRTFMSSFYMYSERGLSGPITSLDSGVDTNEPASMGGGSPEITTGVSFSTLLSPQIACAFAINLNVYCKHTNGIYTLSGYDAFNTAAVALSIGP